MFLYVTSQRMTHFANGRSICHFSIFIQVNLELIQSTKEHFNKFCKRRNIFNYQNQFYLNRKVTSYPASFMSQWHLSKHRKRVIYFTRTRPWHGMGMLLIQFDSLNCWVIKVIYPCSISLWTKGGLLTKDFSPLVIR